MSVLCCPDCFEPLEKETFELFCRTCERTVSVPQVVAEEGEPDDYCDD